MRGFIRNSLLAAILLVSSQVFAGPQISVRIGPPPPPRVEQMVPSPGPDYVWVEGYWYPVGSHYRWHRGYWTRAPYAGASWVGPRYEGGEYRPGYWEGRAGRVEHRHDWDKHRDRDYREHEKFERRNDEQRER